MGGGGMYLVDFADRLISGSHCISFILFPDMGNIY
jgi:hypothetical protein